MWRTLLDDFRTGPANFYTMRILQAIKEGSYDISPSGKLRTFIRQISCRQSLDLRPGKTYLVMGPNKDIRPDSTNQGYSYSMSERIWMEYWPTAEECETEVYKPTCVAIESLVESYLIFGCPSRK